MKVFNLFEVKKIEKPETSEVETNNTNDNKEDNTVKKGTGKKLAIGGLILGAVAAAGYGAKTYLDSRKGYSELESDDIDDVDVDDAEDDLDSLDEEE